MGAWRQLALWREPRIATVFWAAEHIISTNDFLVFGCHGNGQNGNPKGIGLGLAQQVTVKQWTVYEPSAEPYQMQKTAKTELEVSFDAVFRTEIN